MTLEEIKRMEEAAKKRKCPVCEFFKDLRENNPNRLKEMR
jgi:hypothetical protein